MKNINNKKYIERFEENLKEWNRDNDRNYTFEDVQDKFIDVREIGNQKKSRCKNSHCMCGHSIINEYEIVNPENDDTMILGSDCIETYMIKSMSVCRVCDERFKFKPNCNNKCDGCKKIKIKCKKCGEIKNVRKSKKKLFVNCRKCINGEILDKQRCPVCKIKNKNGVLCKLCYEDKCKCKICGYMKKDTKYDQCYRCYNDNKLKHIKKINI